MKLSSILPFLLLLLTGCSLTNCSSSFGDRNVNDFTEKKVNKSNVDTGEEIAYANKDTYSDFQKFIKEANTKITRNEINISEIKLNNVESKDDLNIVNAEMIDELKTSNQTFKITLDNYVQSGTGNWKTFKSELFVGLDELSASIKNVEYKNIL